MPLSEKLNVLWGWRLRVLVGDKFWSATSGWHDKKYVCLIVQLIYVVATHTCLDWTIYWYIDCGQS